MAEPPAAGAAWPGGDGAAILSWLWSPLVVVTAARPGTDGAPARLGAQIAVSAFAASIVPEHPRLLLEIQKRNATHGLIAATGHFAVHLVDRAQAAWVRRFGFVSQRDADKLAGVAWTSGPHGLPILDDAPAYLVCSAVNAMDGGDMTIYLAEVEQAERRREVAPLRWQEMRPLLPASWVEEYGRKLAHDVPDSARRMKAVERGAWSGPADARG